MYKQTISPEEKRRIQGGDISLLLAICEKGNESVVKELKMKRDGSVAFQQGVSHILDALINLLNGAC